MKRISLFFFFIIIFNLYAQPYRARFDSLKVDYKIWIKSIERTPFFDLLNASNHIVTLGIEDSTIQGLDIDFRTINTNNIANNAITGALIANGTILNEDISDPNITFSAGDGLYGSGGQINLGGSILFQVNVDGSTIDIINDTLTGMLDSSGVREIISDSVADLRTKLNGNPDSSGIDSLGLYAFNRDFYYGYSGKSFIGVGFDDQDQELWILTSPDGYNWEFYNTGFGDGHLRNPAILKYNDIYYLSYSWTPVWTATHIGIAKSHDLLHWEFVDTINIKNYFSDISPNRVWTSKLHIDKNGNLVLISGFDFTGATAFHLYVLYPLNEELTEWSQPQLLLGEFPLVYQDHDLLYYENNQDSSKSYYYLNCADYLYPQHKVRRFRSKNIEYGWENLGIPAQWDSCEANSIVQINDSVFYAYLDCLNLDESGLSISSDTMQTWSYPIEIQVDAPDRTVALEVSLLTTPLSQTVRNITGKSIDQTIRIDSSRVEQRPGATFIKPGNIGASDTLKMFDNGIWKPFTGSYVNEAQNLWSDDANTVLHFTFNDTIVDSQEHPYTIVGSLSQYRNGWSAGSRALYFNGSSRIEIAAANATDLDFGINESFSIAAIIKLDSTFSTIKTLISKKAGSEGYNVMLDSAKNAIEFFYGDGINGALQKGGIASSDFWNLYYWVFDTSKDSVFVYINGNIWNKFSIAAVTGNPDNNGNFLIGMHEAQSIHFKGWLSELIIWNDVRNRNEVLADVARFFNPRDSIRNIQLYPIDSLVVSPGGIANSNLRYNSIGVYPGNALNGGGDLELGQKDTLNVAVDDHTIEINYQIIDEDFSNFVKTDTANVVFQVIFDTDWHGDWGGENDSITEDISGKTRNLTVIGGWPDYGKVVDSLKTGSILYQGGMGLKFNNTSHYLGRSNGAGFPNGTSPNYSIVVFGRHDNQVGSFKTMVNWGGNALGTWPQAVISNLQKLEITTSGNDAAGNTSIGLNEKFYYTATMSGTTASVYRNGTLDMTPATITNNPSTLNFRVGQKTNSTNSWIGLIYGITIYNKVLNSQEIKEIGYLATGWFSKNGGITRSNWGFHQGINNDTIYYPITYAGIYDGHVDAWGASGGEVLKIFSSIDSQEITLSNDSTRYSIMLSIALDDSIYFRSSGTVYIDNFYISASQLAIKDAGIDSIHIKNRGIERNDIALSILDSTRIKSRGIEKTDLALNVIDSTRVINHSIENNDLAGIIFGNDSFNGTATTDTVNYSGMTSSWRVIAMPTGTGYNVNDLLKVEKTTNKFIVHRNASLGTSGLTYDYMIAKP